MSEQFQDSGGRSQSGSSKMNRQQCAMQKPRGNRRCSNEHAGVSREQSSKDCRTKNENPGGEAQELIKRAGENLTGMKLERDQTGNGAAAERAENPGAHRHGGAMFEHAQHVKEEMRTAQIHDQ